jgi:hypothetical protein
LTEESLPLNSAEAKKNVQANFAQGNPEFEFRKNQQQQLRKKKRLGTTSPAQSAKIKKEKALEVAERLKIKEVEGFATFQRKQRLDNLVVKDKRAAQDIERQRIKMQRACKHVFNKITKICDCCGKKRSSHV